MKSAQMHSLLQVVVPSFQPHGDPDTEGTGIVYSLNKERIPLCNIPAESRLEILLDL